MVMLMKCPICHPFYTSLCYKRLHCRDNFTAVAFSLSDRSILKQKEVKKAQKMIGLRLLFCRIVIDVHVV